MNENYVNHAEELIMDQINSAKKMCQGLIDALSEGKLDKDLAGELLSNAKNILANAFNQKIELASQMGWNYEKIEDDKSFELKSLDDAVYSCLDKLDVKNNTYDNEIDELLR